MTATDSTTNAATAPAALESATDAPVKASAGSIADAKNPSTGTAPVAVLDPNSSRVARFRLIRSYAAAATVIAACALWFFTLAKLEASTEGIPWYLTVSFIGVICARHVAIPQRVLSALELRQPGLTREPLSLLESWSITFVVLSLGLYIWVSLHCVLLPEPKHKLVQIVDINLVSDADFSDKQSPMPGTEEHDEQHKRDSDEKSMQGSLSATKISEIAQQSHDTGETESAPPAAKEVKTEEHKPSSKASLPEQRVLARNPQAQLLAAPPKKQPRTAVSATQTSKAEEPETRIKLIQPNILPLQLKQSNRAKHDEPLFEEMQPPEMVEMIENDGSRDSNSVFEAGGHSEGGTGLANDLNTYIKELHKRIRAAWSPPRGQSRRAKFLFRIRKDGGLAFIKMIASSSDTDTDAAAVRSITTAVTHKSLPDTYSFPYLDVQYTFNYAADEIREVRPTAVLR